MKRSTRTRSWPTIIALLFIILLCASCVGGKDDKIEGESNIAFFTISDEHCTLERGQLVIQGTITNNCSVPISDVVIRYNIYGDDGKPTRDWGVEPANEWQLYYLSLAPGESDEFRVTGEISDRTNGVASFEFDSFSCDFDGKNDYKKREVTGYIAREESMELVDAAKNK